jgi:TRAP-type C4-dicarboxylate transport system substrate-binding protein
MWEMKEHFDNLSAEQEALVHELTEKDPQLKERSSRERMVDAAIAKAKKNGLTFENISEEQLRAEALAFVENELQPRLGT